MNKKIKLELCPTKDLTDKIIIYYPYNTKPTDLPLNADELVKVIFGKSDKFTLTKHG